MKLLNAQITPPPDGKRKLRKGLRLIISMFNIVLVRTGCDATHHIKNKHFLSSTAEVFSPHPAGQRKAAFTLAEVLITLGIIGVVAAITMPSLVGNYQKKALETQFKKSVSVVSQAIQKAKLDSGIDYFTEFCAYDDGGSVNNGYVNMDECLGYLSKNTFKFTPKFHNPDGSFYSFQRKDSMKTYNGRKTIARTQLVGKGYAIFYTNIMPDGSFLNYWIIERQLYVGIDTNGYKGPNKLGHDIFVFNVHPTKDILRSDTKQTVYTDEELDAMGDDINKSRIGDPCNLISSSTGNGIGCGPYALRNECPYDSRKTYWECLP